MVRSAMALSPGCILVVDDSAVIRRIVARVLERRGHTVVQAADGQAALDLLRGAHEGRIRLPSPDARDGSPSMQPKIELVLLDFVMPKMNGLQFCRALKEASDIPTPSIVLMSAKADRIRERFVDQTGALDAITKPFDPEALSAVVENSLRRARGGTPSATMLPLDLLEPRGMVRGASVPDFDDDAPEGPSATKVGTANLFILKLAQCIQRSFDQSEAELIARLSDAITLDEQAELAKAIDEDRSGVVLSGSFAAIPIGSIFQMIQAEGFTGQLTASHARASIVTTFRDGLIDLVEARGEVSEYRLGRFLVEDGFISSADLQSVLSSMNDTVDDSRLPLGEVLLRARKINRDQLVHGLRRQSSELVYEILRWKDGSFALSKQSTSQLARTARLGLQAATLVVEGFRRIEEWQFIERTLGAFTSPLYPDRAMVESGERLRLSKVEQYVLGLVDGERTIREVVASSNLSTFETCRVLAMLIGASFVRRKSF
jgi:CheY-like chemotaxis protein